MAAVTVTAELGPPMPVKLAYGLGAVGESLWIATVTFVFFCYTAVLGLGRQVGAELPADLQPRLVIAWGPASAILAVAAILTFTAYRISSVGTTRSPPHCDCVGRRLPNDR